MPLFQSHLPDSTYPAATSAPGFFYELRHGEAASGPVQRSALPDVPVARVRNGGDDAECDDEPVLGELAGAPHCIVEFGLILHQVIGGQNEHQGVVLVAAASQEIEGGQGEGRGGVPGHRLDHHLGPLDVEVPHLVEGQEAVGLVAYNHRRSRVQGRDPAQGLLEHGAVADERYEWLGKMFA